MKTPLQAVRAAIEIHGSQAAFSRALGKPHPSYVSELLRRMQLGRKVPAEICPTIERITRGVVTRTMLRPDLWS